MTALLALTRNELRLLTREPLALFWGMGFPVVLLVVFGLIPGFREVSPELGGSTLLAVYLPVIVVLSMSFLAVTGLPTVVATYRERLILKRLATTPVGAPRLLGAQALQSVVVTGAMAAALLAIGRLAFGVPLPAQLFGWVLTLLLLAASLLAIGMFVAAVSPTGKVANALGALLFFPLMFFAGLWIPLQLMPPMLQRIAELTPLGAGVQALQQAAAGSWPELWQLGVLVGYAAAFAVLAAVLFRWE